MGDFIDFPGASGATYRFRLADGHALPATAGNVVIASVGDGEAHVYFCGAARSLAEAAATLRAHAEGREGARLYIRLNVSRSVRDAEHLDLVSALAPPVTDADLR